MDDLTEEQMNNLEQLLIDFIYDQPMKADKAVLFDVLTIIESREKLEQH